LFAAIFGEIPGMPRAIWTGAIQFGLVNVPIRMYSAIEEHTLHFNLLHEKDDGRIGYEKICKDEGKPVPDDEIVKAFEIEKGEYVYVRDEDFEVAAAQENYHSIDIRDFVPYEEIDPIFFERTYYLGPADGSERVYALLVKAMEDSELAGIATFVMRDRQHLGCLRVRDGVITLERMHFADEIRPVDEIRPRRPKVEQKELRMARQLMDSYTGSFEPEKYEDTHRDTLREIIRAKAKGEEIHRPATEEPERPPDLMEALRRSIEASKRRGDTRGDGDRLEQLTKEELYELAKKADISGRSQMGRDELIDALQQAA
jgi:DNA end-binding protein Ku